MAAAEGATAGGSGGGDVFDALHGVEQRVMDEGFDEGEAQGRESGLAEGWDMGLHKGSELGGELGRMAGAVSGWRAAGLLVTERHNKVADDILAAVAAFPFDNPRDEELMTSLLRARAKFKVLSSILTKAGSLPAPTPVTGAALTF